MESSPHELFEYSLALTEIRLSPGGGELSSDARRICACLVLMPDPQVENAVQLAKRIGTYGKIDRSEQYQGRYSSEALLRSINALGGNQRKLERTRFRHHLVAIVLAAMLARAPEIAASIGALLHRLMN